jgi:hypothetical protein
MSETIGRRTILAAVRSLAATATSTSPDGEPCDVVTFDGSGAHDCPDDVAFECPAATSAPRRFCERHVGCATLPVVRVA